MRRQTPEPALVDAFVSAAAGVAIAGSASGAVAGRKSGQATPELRRARYIT
jgi:hypothetical protein